MTMIGGSLDLSRYAKSLTSVAHAKGQRRAAMDAGLMFDFDPRKSKNHKLRGPVQVPLRIKVMLDGKLTTLKVPKGCTMDNLSLIHI